MRLQLYRGWLIHAAGTLGGKFSHKQTGSPDWEEARALAAPSEAGQRWDGVVRAAAEPQPSETKSDRITIERALIAFSSEFGQYAALNTQKKYRLILKKLRAHSDGKGYVLIEQWSPMDVREFRAS